MAGVGGSNPPGPTILHNRPTTLRITFQGDPFNNKTVHIEMPVKIHKKLRAMLFLKEISQQQFFRLVAEKFVEGDSHIINLIEERVELIKSKKFNKIKDIEEKDLYNAIEENSPFKK